jgi:hypothetical protein
VPNLFWLHLSRCLPQSRAESAGLRKAQASTDSSEFDTPNYYQPGFDASFFLVKEAPDQRVICSVMETVPEVRSLRGFSGYNTTASRGSSVHNAWQPWIAAFPSSGTQHIWV